MSHTSEEFLHEDSIPELQGLTFTPEPSSLLQDPIKPMDLDEVASKFHQWISKKDDSKDTSSKVDENTPIVEPKGQTVDENPTVDNVGVAETSLNTVQDTSIKAPDVEPKEGQIVEDSSIDKVASSRVVDIDANIGDKMALVAVPTQAQNIDYSTKEQVQMAGTSNQELQIEVNNRKRSAYELSERLEGWEIIKRLRNNNKTTDKFYVHIKSDIQFRSLNEVDDFVRFALHPKRPGKKPKTDEENASPEAPMEGPPRKRHTRRALAWEFVSHSSREDGTIIYDIKLHGADD